MKIIPNMLITKLVKNDVKIIPSMLRLENHTHDFLCAKIYIENICVLFIIMF